MRRLGIAISAFAAFAAFSSAPAVASDGLLGQAKDVPAAQTLAPVTELAQPVVDTAAPVTQAVAPISELAADAAAPAGTQPLLDTAQPVVPEVGQTLATLTSTVEPVLETTVAVLEATAQPVLTGTGQVLATATSTVEPALVSAGAAAPMTRSPSTSAPAAVPEPSPEAAAVEIVPGLEDGSRDDAVAAQPADDPVAVQTNRVRIGTGARVAQRGVPAPVESGSPLPEFPWAPSEHATTTTTHPVPDASATAPRIPLPDVPGGVLTALISAAAAPGSAGAFLTLLAALAAAFLLAAPGLGRRLRLRLAPWPQPILQLSLERPG